MLTENMGMKHYFKMQRFAFACLGLDVASEERTLTNPLLAFVPMFATISHLVFMLQFTRENIRDVRLATDSLTPVLQMLLALWKYVIFWYKRKEFLSLVRGLWQLNLEVDEAEHPILVAENAKDIIFTRSYFAFANSGCFLSMFSALLGSLFIYMRGGILTVEPPLKAVLPFDHHQNHWYLVFIFAWGCVAAYFVVCGSVAIDGLFSWCMFNTVAQFRILQQRLHLTATAQPGDPSVQRLIACLKYHRNLIDIALAFKEVYSAIIFVKFAISVIQICCVAYQISRGDTPLEMISHSAFLFAVSLQLLIYCYGGQRLQQESESIATAIFASFPWHNMSAKVQKLLLLPMMRSRKACTLSGIFFILDLKMYLWVFRTAASFIALLRTLDEKEH